MRQITMASTTAASPKAGLLRIGVAGCVALLVSQAWTLPEARGAYLAVGLALVLGMLSILGRPEVILRERLVGTLLDSVLIGVLVSGTGGADSLFFPLYFLAALGMGWIEGRAKIVVASAGMVGTYLAALVTVGGLEALESSQVAPRAAFIALFCAVVGFLSSDMHGFRKLAVRLSSTLAKEIDRVESDERLISRFGPVLQSLSLEGMLGWVAETAHAVGGGSYAHVAALNGNHHRTVLEGDFDVCPSWWHPSIQRLVLRCCRGGDTVRSEETIHGIEGFMAVPLGLGDEKWGAVIVGGGEPLAEQERVLKLLAREVAPLLENAVDAPGGLDQLTGLPNRASLRRVLGRELSQGRALTVLAMHLTRFRDYDRAYGRVAGDSLLRRIGERLEKSRQRAFRYGDEFVVVLTGTGERRARKAALELQQHVSAETGNSDHPPSAAAVGWTFAEPGVEEPEPVLGTALRALEEAKGRAEGIAGVPSGAAGARAFLEDLEGEKRVVGITRTLVEALEAKDPNIREHLRAVSHLALRIGREISLPREQVEALTTGALLHDVGKIGIPDRILQKSSRLTEEEYEVIQRHPLLGVEIITPVRDLAPALPIVRHHHERFDGKGYPDELHGEDIPLLARIVSVADAFDSMIRTRPYGYGISQETALQEIKDNSGTQFDPRIVSVLLEVVDVPADRQAGSAS